MGTETLEHKDEDERQLTFFGLIFRHHNEDEIQSFLRHWMVMKHFITKKSPGESDKIYISSPQGTLSTILSLGW